LLTLNCCLFFSFIKKKFQNIHILEKDNIPGGALDGAGEREKGFVVRGGRMHEMHYECYWELLSHVPSLEDENISVRDESFEFNKRFVSNGQARLLKEGKKIDVSSYGLSLKQQSDFLKLTFVAEESLGNKRIMDWFDAEFFETNFWYIWLLHGSNNRVILIILSAHNATQFIKPIDQMYEAFHITPHFCKTAPFLKVPCSPKKKQISIL
jgi:myosin-crossreactive antigen